MVGTGNVSILSTNTGAWMSSCSSSRSAVKKQSAYNYANKQSVAFKKVTTCCHDSQQQTS